MCRGVSGGFGWGDSDTGVSWPRAVVHYILQYDRERSRTTPAFANRREPRPIPVGKFPPSVIVLLVVVEDFSILLLFSKNPQEPSRQILIKKGSLLQCSLVSRREVESPRITNLLESIPIDFQFTYCFSKIFR